MHHSLNIDFSSVHSEKNGFIKMLVVNTRLYFRHTHLCFILNPILAFIHMTFTLLFLVFIPNGVVTSVRKIRALSQHLYNKFGMHYLFFFKYIWGDVLIYLKCWVKIFALLKEYIYWKYTQKEYYTCSADFFHTYTRYITVHKGCG